MRIGAVDSDLILNPRIRSCYNDVIRKTQCIAHKLQVIHNINEGMIDQLPQISEDNSNILSGEIADYFEKIYSCMEYVASILREIYRERGTLESTFHRLLKKTIKNNDSTKIHDDLWLKNYMIRSVKWYAVIHDIRSEETHFSMGRIVVIEGSIVYKINRQTGRETVYDLLQKMKKQPPNQISEYSIRIDEIETIYIGFLSSIKQLEGLLIT